MAAMAPRLYDVLIIGGGPAGLSMATAIARQVHTTLVIDSGEYRNARATHMHNVPGFDHVPPADFRAKVRSDLAKRYPSIEFKSGKISQVKKLPDGVFEAIDEKGEVYKAQKLGLGTGMEEVFDGEVDGLADCWGRGVFHCLFCDGYEERGTESTGILVGGLVTDPKLIVHIACMAKRLSGKVTIYTDKMADLAPAIQAEIHSSRIVIDTRPLSSLALVGEGSKVKLTFGDGSTKIEGFLSTQPKMRQRGGPLVEQLGLETTQTGDLVVSPPLYETSVKGCYAGGDAATPIKTVVQALQMGVLAGAGLVSEVQHEMELKDTL